MNVNVTLPDGTVVQNVPEGMSRADLIAKLKGNGHDTSALESVAVAQPANSTGSGGFIQGLKDPINGAAQLLTHMLPDSVVSAGNRLNNAIAPYSGGLVSPLPPGGIDQQIQNNEAAYQQGRQGAPAGIPGPAAAAGAAPNTPSPSNVDWSRLAGNVLSPANLGMASRVTPAATLFGRVAQGLGMGAVGGATAPVTQPGDYSSQKAVQIGLGAAGGAALPAVAGVAGRLISPAASTNPALQTLTKAGVQPSIGQSLGGVANSVEQKLTSVPLLGGLVSAARARPVQQLNVAAHNRALSPIGDSLPEGLSGREAVDYTNQALSDKYNALLPNVSSQMDGQLFGEINNLRSMISNGSIDPAKASQFESLLQNQVLSKYQPGANGAPTMTGQTLKDVNSDLGQLSSKFGRSLDPDQGMVGDALGEVQDSLRRNLIRSNPNQANDLQAIDTGYANFKRVQRASSSLGADEGTFSPAQLLGAVKASDRSKDKSSFARGNALMQDLGDAGKSVLGSTVPDSGTGGRMLMAGALAGGAMEAPQIMSMAGAHPFLTGAAMSLPAMYSPWGQNLLRTLTTSRPAAAQPIANGLQQIAPRLAPVGAYLGLQPVQ